MDSRSKFESDDPMGDINTIMNQNRKQHQINVTNHINQHHGYNYVQPMQYNRQYGNNHINPPMYPYQVQQSQQMQHIPYQHTVHDINHNNHNNNNNNNKLSNNNINKQHTVCGNLNSIFRRAQMHALNKENENDMNDNNYGYNEPLRKRQKLDDNALVIPAHVIQQQKWCKENNKMGNNIYYIGQSIQIKDSQSGEWINATVDEIKENNSIIVVHFDGCASIDNKQIDVIQHKNQIRNNEKKDEEIPDYFCDPITFERMKQPTMVVGSRDSGHTYEKSVIEECIKKDGKDPLTREKITIDQLVPNRALKDAITAWSKDHPGQE